MIAGGHHEVAEAAVAGVADQDGHNIAEHVAEGVGDGRIGAVIEAVFLVMGQDKIKDIGKR